MSPLLLFLLLVTLSVSQVPQWSMTSFFASSNCSDILLAYEAHAEVKFLCAPSACSALGNGSVSTTCSSSQFVPYSSFLGREYIDVHAYDTNECRDDKPSFAYSFYAPGRCNTMANFSSYMMSCQPNGLVSFTTFSDSNCTNLLSSRSTMGLGNCTSENIAGLPGTSFEYVCPGLKSITNATYNSSTCSTNAISSTTINGMSNCSNSVCASGGAGGLSFATNTCNLPAFSGNRRVEIRAYQTSSCSGTYNMAQQFFSPGVCSPTPNSASGYFRATCSDDGMFASFEFFSDPSCTILREAKTVSTNECSLINASAGLQGSSFSYYCYAPRIWRVTQLFSSLNCSSSGFQFSAAGYEEDQVYDGNGTTCVESSCQVVSLQGQNVSRTVKCDQTFQWRLSSFSGYVSVTAFAGEPGYQFQAGVSAYTFRNGRCNLNAVGVGSYKVGCFVDGTFYYKTYMDSACAILNSSRIAASYNFTYDSVGLPGVGFLYVCDPDLIANQTMTTAPPSSTTTTTTATTTATSTTASSSPTTTVLTITTLPLISTVPSTWTQPATTALATTTTTASSSLTSTTGTTTTPLRSPVVVIIIVFSDPVQSGLSSSLILILSSLTGLPSSSFQAVISGNSQRAGSTATITITSPDASQASATIVSTLSSNAAYLTQQNSAFPSVSSARMSSSASYSTVSLFFFFIVVIIALI